jgi:hypothetical protein
MHMKNWYKRGRRTTLLLLLPALVILAGCSRLLLSYEGARIKQGHAIPIVEGDRQRGRYTTLDVTIDYSYNKVSEDRLEISGTVQLADYFRDNYSLRYFHLSLLVGDEGNTIVKRYPLTSSGYRQRITFDKSLELPQGASAIVFAFTYTGQSVSGGEGGGSWDFWGVPVVRSGEKSEIE